MIKLKKDFVPDYVKISSKVFLDKFEEKNQTAPSGVLFNKYMTLLHRRLKSEGTDIKLPHCWYRWGDEVVRYGMPYLSWDHEYAAYTQVTWSGRMTDSYDPDDHAIRTASEYADEFILKYSGEEGAEMAIDEVYENAPFEFQNEYRKLRETLKQLIKNRKTHFDDAHNNVIIPLFENAVRSFPVEFNAMRNEKESFTEMFRLMVGSKASLRDIFDLIEDFWFCFCYRLRIHKKCHENVTPATLAIWKEKIPEETESFYHNLRIYAHFYYTGQEGMPRAKKLFEEWERDERELRELIAVIPDNNEDEINSFVRKLRTGKE